MDTAEFEAFVQYLKDQRLTVDVSDDGQTPLGKIRV